MLRLYPTSDGWHAPASSLTAADVAALSPIQRSAFDAEMTARARARGFVLVAWGVPRAVYVPTGNA